MVRVSHLSLLRTSFHVLHHEVKWSSSSWSSSNPSLNLYSNSFTGTIPHSLRFRQLKHLDLGCFNGTLPNDFGETAVALRQLYLDHNQFSGTIPESYINVGNGRLTALSLNRNNFTGEVPGDHMLKNTLGEYCSNVEIGRFCNAIRRFWRESYLVWFRFAVQYNLHNNPGLTKLGKETCSLSVFEGGEMIVSLKAIHGDFDTVSVRKLDFLTQHTFSVSILPRNSLPIVRSARVRSFVIDVRSEKGRFWLWYS